MKDIFSWCYDAIEREFNKRNGEQPFFLKDVLSEEFAKAVLEKVVRVIQVFELELETSLDDIYERALKEFRARTPIKIEKSINLSKGINNWLSPAREEEAGWADEHNGSYQSRYVAYLVNKGRSKKVVDETKRSCIEIVRKLGDPRSADGFYRRGMVVGSVQSGKTANFNAVINSSIDVGYELIIVFSGLMEDLRRQSQERIDQEVIGRWTSGYNYQGVGDIKAFEGPSRKEEDQLPEQIESITSMASDFTSAMVDANNSIAGKNLLVCKKNVHVLENLIVWLSGFVDEGKIDVPLLIIDDEADNASINNDGYDEEKDPSKTNLLIRAILGLFDRKTYLGYTATPFANLLQYRQPDNKVFLDGTTLRARLPELGKLELADELFPENFIELLRPPSNYFGIKKFFDTREKGEFKIEPLIEVIDDGYVDFIPPRVYKDSLEGTLEKGKGIRATRKDDPYPSGLPKSLCDAIDAFILSIALRYSRADDLRTVPGYSIHHTMLVHVSRFSSWQNTLAELIESRLQSIRSAIVNAKRGDAIFSELERVWNNQFYQFNKNYKSYLSEHVDDPFLGPKSFSVDILPNLPQAVKGIEVLAVNSSPQGRNLEYGEFEKKYIAVGGNRLSRGFTLEGLTVSYFLREANTMDTLMQMGRWFGYRPGYIDACKLFTTRENVRKFNQASLVIEDLEQKFLELSKLPNRTPNDFTIWIQNNPDVIRLTRPNLLKGELKRLTMSYGDSIKMSTEFNINQRDVANLWNNFCSLASTKSWEHDEEKGFLIFNTDQQGLLEFLEIDGSDGNERVMLNLDTTGLGSYLEDCKRQNALINWKIAIRIGGEGDDIDLGSELGLHSIPAKKAKRVGPKKGSTHSAAELAKNEIFRARNSSIVSSPKDFSITLTADQIKRAESSFYHDKAVEIQKQGDSNFESALKKAKKKSVPDKVYRNCMDESTGLLIVYLIDYAKIFDDSVRGAFDEIAEYCRNNKPEKFGLPLLGYALGFPRVKSVEGRDFITRTVATDPWEKSNEELKQIIESYELDDDVNSLTREEMIDLVSEFYNET